jgi:hypothetical protein
MAEIGRLLKLPFKSKHYYAIIDRIAELENGKEELEAEKAQHKQTLQPKEYCSLACKIADMNKQIKLLRSLL